jgi:DNA polymerase-3 subunit epsilon
LLDAELLADVYIAMTRGQNALEMNDADMHDSSGNVLKVDLSGFDLPIVEPTEDELQLHENMLQGIDKASNSKTLWRLVAV